MVAAGVEAERALVDIGFAHGVVVLPGAVKLVARDAQNPRYEGTASGGRGGRRVSIRRRVGAETMKPSPSSTKTVPLSPLPTLLRSSLPRVQKRATDVAVGVVRDGEDGLLQDGGLHSVSPHPAAMTPSPGMGSRVGSRRWGPSRMGARA